MIGLILKYGNCLAPSLAMELAAGPRRAAVGHIRAPRLPFRRQPRVSLPGFEGIVSKRLGSRYRSGRSPDWLKMKNPEAPAVKREAEEDWGKKR